MIGVGIAGMGLLMAGMVTRLIAKDAPEVSYVDSWQAFDNSLTTLGALLLAIYAVQIGSVLFMVLNGTFTCIGLVGSVIKLCRHG